MIRVDGREYQERGYEVFGVIRSECRRAGGAAPLSHRLLRQKTRVGASELLQHVEDLVSAGQLYRVSAHGRGAGFGRTLYWLPRTSKRRVIYWLRRMEMPVGTIAEALSLFPEKTLRQSGENGVLSFTTHPDARAHTREKRTARSARSPGSSPDVMHRPEAGAPPQPPAEPGKHRGHQVSLERLRRLAPDGHAFTCCPCEVCRSLRTRIANQARGSG